MPNTVALAERQAPCEEGLCDARTGGLSSLELP